MSDWIDVKPQMTLAKFLRGEDYASPYVTPLVGLLLQLESGEYLIGDLNELGGVCDDCHPHDHETVFKYKRIWDGEIAGIGTVAPL